jgi:hypothetical protein
VTRRIVTHYWQKPVPSNEFDWQAIDDNTYEPGCPIGYGATEQAAIDNLMEQLDE